MQRRRHAAALMALLALAGLLSLVAGCSDDEAKVEEPVVADLTADEIVAQGEQAMQDVTSLSFRTEFSVALEGDVAEIEDPADQMLLESPLSMTASGASSDDPVAADVELDLAGMGQSFKMQLRAVDEQAWVGYEDQWYVIPQEEYQSALGEEPGDEASPSALPTEQLKEMGLDPTEWDLTWELVGVDSLGEEQAYHVRGTADPGKLAESLTKALEDPALAERLGEGMAGQTFEGLTGENRKQLRQLKEALERVSVDVWYEVGTFYLRKVDAKAGLDMTGVKDAEGLTGMTIALLVELDGFDEPVEVEAPADALPFEQLMQQMFGGFGFGAGDGTMSL
jgi:hypothetical protein